MRRFYPGITLFKLAGATLVLVAHALLIPSMVAMDLPPLASFLMLEGRVVVPCFYVVSGFLLYKGWSHASKPGAYVRKYWLRIAAVYAVFCLLFAAEFNVPALLQGGLGLSNLILQTKILVMAVFVNGPLLQLWFIPPLLFGSVAAYWLLNRLSLKMILIMLAVLYGVVQLASGSLLSFTGMGQVDIASLPGILWTGATRYLGFGLTFVVMGALMAKYEEQFLRMNVRLVAVLAIGVTAAETVLLTALAPWSEAYKLTFAMLPNTALLFYGVLRIRNATITAHHRLLNLFSIVTFVGHIPLMRLNKILFGWGGSLDLVLWQQMLQSLLTFAECAALTLLLYRRSRKSGLAGERAASPGEVEAAAGMSSDPMIGSKRQTRTSAGMTAHKFEG
ncbi:hypothetical protein PAT3040_05590 [Paenibacillus agaridevorans]|uniref:Acyltransferase 3 domain-containing protein n=1 Tax=Paenibacillus agaridevorans TaxID=171404 RepID=A0A2R5F452_9BACL|nr:acyltransferase [Paenibacillus agaridevorans]GBG10824.1 hypothetical protein PAT3040_05590 [Paenibacillus agaridevorans]